MHSLNGNYKVGKEAVAQLFRKERCYITTFEAIFQ
ncbi:hypothetical protein SGRA_1741 [Saprospira grandis str. Lewin]|uniref:Uncharacterized protein n=1 Tax=Saprospira grandis (strain Lewin) TaxID=984262 RepID=H6KZ86_SAPGL|nr:hypothetical protein SGRA_1741 [Saprospira grandis str. Lewin]